MHVRAKSDEGDGPWSEAVWSFRDAAEMAPANDKADPSGRLEAEAGYGLAGPARVEGTVTPYAGCGLAGEDARTWHLGVRWTLGSDVTLGLEGTRRETADDDEHGVMFRIAIRW